MAFPLPGPRIVPIDTGYKTACMVSANCVNLSRRSTSRKAFINHYGYAPQLACHHCDVPACINPEHLYEGDHKQNGVDGSARKRMIGAVSMKNNPNLAYFGGVYLPLQRVPTPRQWTLKESK